jgi:glycosyltransferase 2 family protein
MEATTNKRLVQSGLGLATVLVTVVFSYFALRDVRYAEVWRALKQSDLIWLLPAFAMLALAIFMRAVRWQTLFAPASRPPLGAVTSALLVGYLFNNILPARAGEAARVVALNQRTNSSRAEIVGTIVVERVFDVLCVLIIFFAAAPWLPSVSWIRPAATLAVVLAVGVGVAIVLLVRYEERSLIWVMTPLSWLPFFSRGRIDAAASRLADGLVGLRRPNVALQALAWTTSSWLALALSAWLVTLAFSFDLPIAAGVLIASAIGLAMILPSAPAALGVFEGATLVALRAYDISPSPALSYALVLHALNFLPFIVAGLAVLHFHVLAFHRRARQPQVQPR